STKIAVVMSLFKYPIIFIHLDAWINHDDSFEPIGGKITYHLLRVRKIVFVPGKTTVAVHIVDIQIDGITRYFPLSKFCRHLSDFIFGIITPTALMIA